VEGGAGIAEGCGGEEDGKRRGSAQHPRYLLGC